VIRGYGAEPPTPAQRRVRRTVGAAALALVAALLFTLHIVRQQRAASGSVGAAFASLAAGDLPAAESAFSRGLGSLSPDPLAMLGVAVIDDMARFAGKPLPAEPAGALDERGVIAHARVLLAHRRPDLALAFAARAGAHLGRKESLAVVQLFAELWLAALKDRAREPPEVPR